MVDQFNASGDCYDEKANFDQITAKDVDQLEWVIAFTHHEADLDARAGSILRRRKLDDAESSEYASKAWEKFFQYRETLVWNGPGTILNILVAYVDNLARSESRRRGTNPVSTFSEFDGFLSTKSQQKETSSGDNESAAENLLSPHPAAEERYIDIENFAAVRTILAKSLKMMPEDEGMMAALWFFVQWKPKVIAQYMGKKDLRNKLHGVKETFIDALYMYLDAHVEQYPGDHDAALLRNLLEIYPQTNKDGDLNQKHVFVSYLSKFVMPDEIDTSVNRWYTQFIDSLMHRRLIDL